MKYNKPKDLVWLLWANQYICLCHIIIHYLRWCCWWSSYQSLPPVPMISVVVYFGSLIWIFHSLCQSFWRYLRITRTIHCPTQLVHSIEVLLYPSFLLSSVLCFFPSMLLCTEQKTFSIYLMTNKFSILSLLMKAYSHMPQRWVYPVLE